MNQPTFLQKTLAFSVHLFTASGMVAGFMAILAIGEKDFKTAMLWLVLTLFIDGVDGTFARLFKVKEVLPNFDGKSIDYVIDFATYAIIPTYFIYEANLLPDSVNLFGAAVILLVSAVYYGKDGMVSSDYYFIGFPVLWNLVAFYLFFVINLSPWVNFFFILFFALLHFIPIKFLYPSRTVKFRTFNLMASALFFLSNVLILWTYPEVPFWQSALAVFCMIYFGILAVYHTYFDVETKSK